MIIKTFTFSIFFINFIFCYPFGMNRKVYKGYFLKKEMKKEFKLSEKIRKIHSKDKGYYEPEDVKEAIQNLQEELKENDGVQQIEDNLSKSFKGNFNNALKDGYEMDKNYVIVDWVFFHKLLKKVELDKAFEKYIGDLK